MLCHHTCHLHIRCALSLVHTVVQIAKQSQSVHYTPEEGRGPKCCAMEFYKIFVEHDPTLFLCLSVCMSVCLSVCLSVRLSVCLYVCMYACMYVFLSFLLSFFLLFSLSVCLSLFLHICLATAWVCILCKLLSQCQINCHLAQYLRQDDPKT